MDLYYIYICIYHCGWMLFIAC